MTAPSLASIQSGNLVSLARIRRKQRKKYLIDFLKVTLAFAFGLIVLVASPKQTILQESTGRTTNKPTVVGSRKRDKELPPYDGIESILSLKNIGKIRQKFDNISNGLTQDRRGGRIQTKLLRERLHKYLITGSPQRTSKLIDDRTVQIWIAGSSAAAGYGNLPSQSYGALLAEFLADEDLNFVVDSSAMADISPFPYSWCLLDHNWGNNSTPDVIIYDFDEDISKPNPANLETFLRTIARWRPDAMIIMRRLPNDDSHTDLFKYYSQSLNLAVLADLSEELLDDTGHAVFGLPASAESLHSHNLSIQQHLWTALVLALHIAASFQSGKEIQPTTELPRPIHLSDASLHLLDQEEIHCRTSYDQVSVQRDEGGQSIQYDTTNKSLSDLRHIMSTQHLDWDTATSLLLLPRNVADFRRGWMWGLADRRSKLRQTTHYHDDWKVALFGLSMSGALQFTLQSTLERPISSVMVCEADDRAAECRLGRDGTLAMDVPVKRIAETNQNMCLWATLQKPEPRVKINVTVSNYRKPCSVAHVIWTTTI